MWLTYLMSDDALIRKSNIRRLGKSASALADLGIGGYSYWAALLAENSKKAFGEKAARKLESKLSLPRGCLDVPDSDLTPEKDPWPFEGVVQARYEALSPIAQGAAQKAMMDEIVKQEQMRKDRLQANG